MTRRLAAPVGILAAGVFLLGPAGPAGAQETPLPRQAFLFLVDRVSFEEVLAVPQFRALARSGGAGLASFRPLPGDRGLGPYLTIGAGAQAEVPMSRLAPGGDGVSSLDLGLIERANDTATPGLLATSLLERGRSSALYGNDDDRFGPNVPGALVAMDRQGRVRGSDEGATLPAPTELGAVRTNGEALLRRFVTDRARGIRSDLVVFDLGDTHRVNEEAPYAAPGVAAAARAAALRSAGRFVEGAVRASDSPQVLVVVATPGTSIDMRRVGDAVTPMIVARGEPDRLFPRSGATHALTSSSTRHAGVVAEDDVAPTILSFLGVPVPAEMTGAPIERLAEPAPFDLHRRHLEHRRIRVPVQAVFGAAVALGALLAFLALWFRRRLSSRARSAAAVILLATTSVPTALLLVGLLPHLVYRQVIPATLAIMVGLALLAWRRRGVDPAYPLLLVAVAGAVAVVVDGLFGWRAMATPLLGVTIFEGRSYGIRNAFVGPLLAGVIMLGSRLPPRRALVLILATAVFVGFPGLGSEVGGAATLLAAAPLLYFCLSGRRIRVRELAITIGTVAVGLALLFAGDALLTSAPTHAGRLAQRVASTGFGAFLRVAGDRLAATIRTTSSVPPAWLAVTWFALAAWLAPRVRGAVGTAFDRSPGHRTAMWTIAVAALIAVVVNDTGIATALAILPVSLAGFLLPPLNDGGTAEDRGRPVRERSLAGAPT